MHFALFALALPALALGAPSEPGPATSPLRLAQAAELAPPPPPLTDPVDPEAVEPAPPDDAAEAPPPPPRAAPSLPDSPQGPGMKRVAAAVATGVASAVVALPTAALCGTCVCLGAPGAVVCVPGVTGLTAAVSLAFAGVELGDAFLPALAAASISLASGVLALGAGLFYGIAFGALTNTATNVGVDPTLTSTASVYNRLAYASIAFGAMALGAAGAGAAVYFLWPAEEPAAVASAKLPTADEPPAPSSLVSLAMAY